jgi:hypothetical protein
VALDFWLVQQMAVPLISLIVAFLGATALFGHPILDLSQDKLLIDADIAISGATVQKPLPDRECSQKSHHEYAWKIARIKCIARFSRVAHDVEAGHLLRCFDIGPREGGYYVVHVEGVMRHKAVCVFRDWLIAQGQDADVQDPGDIQPNG